MPFCFVNKKHRVIKQSRKVHIQCAFLFYKQKTQSYRTVTEGTQKCVLFCFAQTTPRAVGDGAHDIPQKRRYRLCEQYYLQSLIPSLRINAPCHPSLRKGLKYALPIGRPHPSRRQRIRLNHNHIPPSHLPPPGKAFISTIFFKKYSFLSSGKAFWLYYIFKKYSFLSSGKAFLVVLYF